MAHVTHKQQLHESILSDLQRLDPAFLVDIARAAIDRSLQWHEDTIRTQKGLWGDAEGLSSWLESTQELERAATCLMQVP